MNNNASQMTSEIERAMWEGNINRLSELAPCRCCCAEHYRRNCPAEVWEGCRGDRRFRIDHDAWAKFYKQARGMSREVFYGEMP